MEAGTGKDSYHCNSSLQAKGFKPAKDLIKQVIASNALLLDSSLKAITVADLGCSSGSNTLNAMAFVAEEITASRRRSSCPSVEIQAAFSDLTANDFNTLFSLVPHLQGEPYFFSGVPGSFYGRLFPRSSIHFAMTNYALHFVSKIPEAVTDKNSPAWNKNKYHIDSSSPPAALEAYARQADEDLRNFLSCRAQELATGAILSLMFSVRFAEDIPEIGLALQAAWEDLIKEGVLSQESLDSFNLPTYPRTLGEVYAALESFQHEFQVIREEKLAIPLPDSRSGVFKAATKGFIAKHIENLELAELLFEKSLSVDVAEECQDVDIMLVILLKK